jgi:predicted esterase YcpF (UPF0227 family)
MAKVVIYLHGLGSRGQSAKSELLREALREIDVELIAPDLPLDPTAVVEIVKDLVTSRFMRGDLEKLVFCGTSLGGFYSTYFGEIFDAPYVAVNPVVSPSEAFKRHLNNPPLNYVTNTPLEFSQSILDSFKNLEAETSKPSGVLANVFLAKDDDVVPYDSPLQHYKHADVTVTQDGGHRYDSRWSLVIERVKKLCS